MNIIKLIKNNLVWSVWVLAFLFLLVLLIKCVTFINFTAFFTSPFKDKQTIAMYIGICGIISSFVFLFRWKWWTVVISVILDIWLIGNLVYWRSYQDLLSVYSLEAAGNLTGFYSSIFLFLEWKDAVFPMSTLLLAVVIIYLPNKNRRILLPILFCFPLSVICTFPQIKRIKVWDEISHPLSYTYISDYWYPNIYHCTRFSPITYLLLQLSHLNSISKEEKKPKIDIEDLKPFLQIKNDTDIRENWNLILVIFESLEAWVINSEINNQEITPNLNKLYSSQHILFADRVSDQTRTGKSMDGQMIINTGLLPIYQGVTTKRYLNNLYYSITNALQTHTKSSYIDHWGEIWNERKAVMVYGYDTVFTRLRSDYLICKRAIENIDAKPYVLQIVTRASHAPFNFFNDSSSLITPKDMPVDMANYIKSANYTDKALGLLFDKVNLDSTIIMVTGDHIVFHAEKRKLFQQYCNKNDINIPVEKTFLPLIIYSPEIKERVVVTDTIYQMDIYPTLLFLLHREDYIWKGFGINLLDPDAKRKILPDEALKLSDAVIRNDYFRTIKE